MTIAEIMKAKGIDEETIKGVLEDMKTNKVFTASEENLDVRFGKVKTDNEAKDKQLTEANALIEEMKKATKGQEGLQQKVAAYEEKVAQLQTELEQTKLNAAIKVELLTAKAADVDYLTFKLSEKLKADGETLTLDENGAIKGWGDKLSGLKTQFPTMFAGSDGDGKGYKVLDPNKLGTGDGGAANPTKESFQAMTYEQRVALKKENEELYKQLAH